MKRAKFYLLFCCTLLIVRCGKDPIGSPDGTFKDSRDKHVYKYVKIGTQTWMAENLAYLPAVSPSSDGSEFSAFYYVYNYQGSSISKAKSKGNYTSYGVLYNWEAAKIACPSGLHLPTDNEWTTLTEYLTNNGYGYGGSGTDIGKSMASTSGWTTSASPGTIGIDQGSNNRSGFTALPGGSRYSFGSFYDLGDRAYYWSASEDDESGAWSRDLYTNFDGVYRYYNTRSNGFSVRCLQNN